MGVQVNSSTESNEPKKRLKKVRSVKFTNLDRFRLSMKRSKSRLSQELVLDPKESPHSKFQESPNYMKATSCFNARKGSLQPDNSGNSPIARKSTKGMQRMYSLKRLRKLPSLKQGMRRSVLSRDSSTHLDAFHGNAELRGVGDDLEGFEEGLQHEVFRDQEKESTMRMGQARMKLIRSGSIKVTRVRSIKLSRRRWSRSRLDEASVITTDDEAEELTPEAIMSDLQANDMEDTGSYNMRKKTINNYSSGAPGLKSMRTLWKMPSLRPKRRPVKKQSKTAELNGRRFDSSTCSSALKSSKVPEVDHVSGVCESENEVVGYVCPYTYCSLHGHLHAPSPPLKGFISTKRRLLKKQRSIRLQRKPKKEAAYRNLSRMNQSMQEHADPLMSEIVTENLIDTEGSNEEIFVEIYAKPRDISTPGSIRGRDAIGNGSEGRECDVLSSESTTESSEACSASIKSDDLDMQSSAGECEISTTTADSNILFDKKRYSNMWRLIYKHLSVPGSGTINEEGEKMNAWNAKTSDNDGSEYDQNQHHGDENQDMNLDNQVEENEKLEFNQAEAIEFVQQAVEDILHLDEQSRLDQIINPDMVLNDAEVCRNAEETTDPGKQDFREHNVGDEYPRELKDIQQPNNGGIVRKKEDSNEGTQPKRQRSKGFEKLRKMILTAKFIKAVEKLRRISPQKPRFLSAEEQPKVERVQLRHLSMDQRRNSEGWMLDFALQQVIAKLAPAQQRRVGMLVQAFERVTPETNMHFDQPKMPPASYTAPPSNVQKEERSIALDLDNSGSCDNNVQDPERTENLDASVTIANGEDYMHPGMIDGGSKFVLKLDPLQKVDDPKQSILQKVDETTDAEVLSKSIKSRDETESMLQDPLQDPTNSPWEETNFPFDKEKFTNVWNMVYQKFIANEDTTLGEKKVDVREQDEIVSASNSNEGSEPSLRQFDMKNVAKPDASAGTKKHEVYQANAIQLVQEAIDELLRLHEQLSDQQPSKSCNKEGQLCSSDPTDPAKNNSNSNEILVMKEAEMTEPGRAGTDDQKALQRQPSKPNSKLKKLVLSAKFIMAMEKLRKIRSCKTENASSQASSEAEKVYLRHLSMDGRRNSEEWMFDNALQQVVSKLAPAQQRRVALLTQAFETLTPELEQMSTKHRRMKMQPKGYAASTTKQKNEDGTFVVMDHENFKIHGDKAHKSDYTSPEEASAAPAHKIEQEDHVKKGCPPCCSDNIQIEHKENTDIKANNHSHQEQTLIGSHEDEQKANVPKDAITDRKYSKMWKLIYRYVKSNSTADGEFQPTEIRVKGDQTDDALVETDEDVQTTDATCEKLEISQSDAINLVQEAVDGILLQCSSLEQPSKVVSKEENEEGNKSEQNAFQGYSKLKRAIICGKFVKAMEKMQKLHAQKKRRHYNPHIPDREAETVYLRQCLIDERSNSEEWMLDYALRQVITKLAPVQRKKVVMLIEAFETVGPNPEETSKDPQDSSSNEYSKKEMSLESCQHLKENSSSWPSNEDLNGDGETPRIDFSGTSTEAVDTHPANTSARESSPSQDIGKDTNSDRSNIILDGQKNSSMWRLIYQHIKSGIPNGDTKYIPDEGAEQISTQTDTHGPESDAETLDEETPCDSHRSSTDNENEDKSSDSADTKLQQKDAIKLVEEAVNEILQMQSSDDQSIDPEEKTTEDDKARQELPRSYSMMSKVILCKKFIKAMEKKKKSKPKDKRYLPQQPDSPAENVHLRAQRMAEKNNEELMLDYALQQVIGKLAPTQKKKVSMLVEAFERVNPLPDSRRHQRLNAVA